MVVHCAAFSETSLQQPWQRLIGYEASGLPGFATVCWTAITKQFNCVSALFSPVLPGTFGHQHSSTQRLAGAGLWSCRDGFMRACHFLNCRLSFDRNTGHAIRP